MELKLIRDTFTPHSTTGKLFIGDSEKEFCFVLEDCVRAVKIQGETAIPEGRYRVKLTQSVRFKRIMPLIENVKAAGSPTRRTASSCTSIVCCSPGRIKRYTTRASSTVAESQHRP